MSNQVSGGKNIDEENSNGCDPDLSAFEVMSDDKIVRHAQGTAEYDNHEKEVPSTDCIIKHCAVLNHLKCLLDYLDGQDNKLLCDKINLEQTPIVYYEK